MLLNGCDMSETSEKKPPVGGFKWAGEEVVARVLVYVLPGGRLAMSADCRGAPDAVYAPMADDRLPWEIGRLVAELRQRAQEPAAPAVDQSALAVTV